MIPAELFLVSLWADVTAGRYNWAVVVERLIGAWSYDIACGHTDTSLLFSDAYRQALARKSHEHHMENHRAKEKTYRYAH